MSGAEWVFWSALALLAYALLGYPALMAAVGALWPPRTRPADDDVNLPTVTLVIPAYNESRVITAKLENALAIDYPAEKLEVLVADDASSDGTAELARPFEARAVRLLAFTERRGKTSLLNDASRAARNDVLCLCDANVLFRRDALRRLVAPLTDRRVGAVTGDVRLASEESNFEQGERLYYQIERAMQLGESRTGSLMGVDGGMYVVRRSLFQSLPADTILDDFVLSMRVIRQGYRVVYEPRAIADENGTPTAEIEFRRRLRLSAGAMQALKRGDFPRLVQPLALWQYASHKLLRLLMPVLLLVAFLANVALFNRSPFYLTLLLGQLACYGAALVGMARPALRSRKAIGVPFYFAMGNVGLLYGGVRGLFDLQPVTWRRTERAAGASNDPAGSASSQEATEPC